MEFGAIGIKCNPPRTKYLQKSIHWSRNPFALKNWNLFLAWDARSRDWASLNCPTLVFHMGDKQWSHSRPCQKEEIYSKESNQTGGVGDERTFSLYSLVFFSVWFSRSIIICLGNSPIEEQAFEYQIKSLQSPNIICKIHWVAKSRSCVQIHPQTPGVIGKVFPK
jgi:hypothetical protein